VSAALIVLAAVAVGCGDDGGAPATTTPTSTTAAFGPDRGDGVLRVASHRLDEVQAAAVELAVEDVNAAAGVLGAPVELVDDGADVVVGTGRPQAGVAWIAPSGPEVPTADDGRLSFRTGADRGLLAEAVADLVADDGYSNPVVVADRRSPLADALVAVGFGDDPAAADAVVLLDAADPTATLDRLRLDAGVGIYLLGGRHDRDGAPEGAKVVEPGAEVGGELRRRLPDVDDPTGAAEAYDAVVIAALAAEAAGTDDPERLGAEVIGVTRGGATCLAFDECRDLLADGQDVDLDGLGGSYALDVDGWPTESAVTVLEYAADRTIDPNRTEYRVAVRT
jgi:branched-chain amino acid transport system substrate-binding protein